MASNNGTSAKDGISAKDSRHQKTASLQEMAGIKRRHLCKRWQMSLSLQRRHISANAVPPNDQTAKTTPPNG
jgi:hypothetical protein